LAEYRLAAYERQARRRRKHEEGQILVLFAMAIVVIMLFASIVIDLGLLRNNRQILVNAVDAAALAGGTLLPVDGCNNAQNPTADCASVNSAAFNAVNNLIIATLQGTYPGISASNYTITYRCLIGLNPQTGQPHVSRDVPIVCNPRMALGHTPVASDFKGAGPTRYSACRPDLGDKCNVVVVTGATTTPYSFGRVVGVNEGNTGTTVSAACNGPCGQPPSAPVDLVVLLDRTASMEPGQIADARDALRAVLEVYDPALQRVALGFLGPSERDSTCSGGGGGPAVNVNAITDPSPAAVAYVSGSSLTNANGSGSTTLSINAPSGLSFGEVLVAAITVQGGTNTTVTPPGAGGGSLDDWTLIRRTNIGTTLSLLTYYRVIVNQDGDGSEDEPSSYVWTFSSSQRASGGISLYQNVDTSNPVQTWSEASNNDTSSPYLAIANQVGTGVDDADLLAFMAINNGITSSTSTNDFWQSPPTSGDGNGMSERFDRRGGAANAPSIVGLGKNDDTAGPSGTTTWRARQGNNSGGGNWIAQHVVLRPDVTNAYGTNYPADLDLWIPIGFTGTDSDTPTFASIPGGHSQAYVDANGNLQNNTHIVSAINCFNNPGGTGTNLTTPIAMAAAYLQQYGRPNVKWGILFETDGEPSYSSTGDPGNYTCAAAVDAAHTAKLITNAQGKNIELFTVGFLAGSDPNCPDGGSVTDYLGRSYQNQNVTLALSRMASSNSSPSPNGSANGCVASENTDQDHFFCEPDSADLEEVFATIATEFAGIRTHLIQLSPPPFVNSLTPDNGPPGGGAVVINGKYFTGTTQVAFGGIVRTCPAQCTIVSDTQITVTAPAGASNSKVNVIVTNDGGSSLPHSGSVYTYN
jgi:hypothetical protein